MIKSLQVLRRFVFSEWGGTETVVWNTSQELQRSGNPVEILSSSALDQSGSEEKENIKIKRFSYFYPYLNMSKVKRKVLDKKGGDPYSLSLYKYMRRAENIDIIHCHTMNRIAASVRLVCHQRKIPYLVSFHGGHFDVPKAEMEQMIEPYRGTFNYGKFIDNIIKKKRYLKDADAIICVGYNEYEITKDKYPQKLVYYLPNGVNTKKFSNIQINNFRSKYQIPDNRKIILCLSRIDYQKNQELLVYLLERLTKKNEEAHLVLVGPVTSRKYFQKIMDIVEKKNLENRITVIKGLKADDPQLVMAYQTADVFILPSIHEPFGIVVLEAWASGTPVIAASVGGLKRLINQGETGLLFDGSIEDLEAKYYQLTKDNKLSKKLVMAADKLVKSKYSWQSVTNKLLEYYCEIIEQYRIKK